MQGFDWQQSADFLMNFWWVLIIAAVVLLIIWNRRRQVVTKSPEESAEALLERRYASGDISKEEFEDMKKKL